ncbi:MAG: hypothetical protein U5L00_16515 [Desulfovermiculus sp.]|nr:hypothetical protein [Desulfovermiculus sp.]
MSKHKGRVLKLQARLKGQAPDSDQKPSVRLRGNELYRLLSIINKVNWGRELNAADKQDLDEIEAIEQGHRPMIYPEKRFFPPAFSRHDQNGILCWFQDLSQGPIRELTPAEKDFWKQVGPTGFHGYLRLNETVQAYLLSGCEDSPMPFTYGHPMKTSTQR